MHHLLMLFFSQNRRFSRFAVFLLTLLLAGWWNPAQAETAATAPPQLTNLLAQINAAANKHDVNTVVQYYSQNFTNSDGLTRLTLEKALTQLWQRYPNLKYQTQLQSWQQEGKVLVAETVTTITATQSLANRNLVLNSTIKSRQRLQGTTVIQQEVLSERSQTSIGAKPPVVEVNLPQQVKTGQQYEFDAVVQKPLDKEYLLGAATEEPIKAERYLNPTSIDLELLSSGGLFKQGQAPAKPQSLWISGLLIGADGMTSITQRLQVVDNNTTANFISPQN